MTLARIQKAISKAGIPLELVRGSGYQYFIFDDANHFETKSVCVCYLNQLTVEQWVEAARSAMFEINARISDN
jgi:hypothetical protein